MNKKIEYNIYLTFKEHFNLINALFDCQQIINKKKFF